jgi:toxin ParE1/3/4
MYFVKIPGEKMAKYDLKNAWNCLNFIRHNPLVFHPDELGRRKYIVKKFPYLLIYKVKKGCIYILAVAHGARKPGYWKSRDTKE